MSDMNSFMGSTEDDSRRILIYFVLDVSSSMQGSPLQAVQDGLESMVSELNKTPEAVELAHLCVITFGSNAQIAAPLVPLANFTPPHLAINGSTNMSAGLELVNRQIDLDFRPNKGGAVRGDYKPLIFLMTDGAPDSLDTTIRAAQKLRNRSAGKTIGTFLALGCGQGANENNLRQIAPVVALMHDMTAENIKAFFIWVSASISSASKKASRSTDENASIEAPPIPKNASGDSAFVFKF